jgi:hypothetical protein
LPFHIVVSKSIILFWPCTLLHDNPGDWIQLSDK